MPNARTPALIFDFGNVVAFFDYTRAADRLGARHGIPGAALLAQAQSMGFLPLVKRYESGGMTAAEFARAVGSLVGLDVTPEEFAAAWAEVFWLNEPTVELAAFLKGRGYSLVLGSNTNDVHAAHFRRQFAEALSAFDRMVLSFEVGHIKPAPEFYAACVEAAGVAPGECVFIDDLAENVEGARAAGLVGVHYTGHAALLDDLRRLGVEVPA